MSSEGVEFRIIQGWENGIFDGPRVLVVWHFFVVVVVAFSSQTTVQAAFLLLQGVGVSLFTQKPSVTWPFKCLSSHFQQEKCRCALRNGTIRLPNSTVMDHFGVCRVRLFSSVCPAGVGK